MGRLHVRWKVVVAFGIVGAGCECTSGPSVRTPDAASDDASPAQPADARAHAFDASLGLDAAMVWRDGDSGDVGIDAPTFDAATHPDADADSSDAALPVDAFVCVPTLGEPDGDRDGVVDRCDNCPHATNPRQLDLDGDGLGWACDAVEEILGATRDPRGRIVTSSSCALTFGSELMHVGPDEGFFRARADLDPRIGFVGSGSPWRHGGISVFAEGDSIVVVGDGTAERPLDFLSSPYQVELQSGGLLFAGQARGGGEESTVAFHRLGETTRVLGSRLRPTFERCGDHLYVTSTSHDDPTRLVLEVLVDERLEPVEVDGRPVRLLEQSFDCFSRRLSVRTPRGTMGSYLLDGSVATLEFDSGSTEPVSLVDQSSAGQRVFVMRRFSAHTYEDVGVVIPRVATVLDPSAVRGPLTVSPNDMGFAYVRWADRSLAHLDLASGRLTPLIAGDRLLRSEGGSGTRVIIEPIRVLGPRRIRIVDGLEIVFDEVFDDLTTYLASEGPVAFFTGGSVRLWARDVAEPSTIEHSATFLRGSVRGRTLLLDILTAAGTRTVSVRVADGGFVVRDVTGLDGHVSAYFSGWGASEWVTSWSRPDAHFRVALDAEGDLRVFDRLEGTVLGVGMDTEGRALVAMQASGGQALYRLGEGVDATLLWSGAEVDLAPPYVTLLEGSARRVCDVTQPAPFPCWSLGSAWRAPRFGISTSSDGRFALVRAVGASDSTLP